MVSDFRVFQRNSPIYLRVCSVTAILNNAQTRVAMDTEFQTVAPICFLYERDTERSMNISTKLRKEFLNAPILDDRSLSGLNHVSKTLILYRCNLSYIKNNVKNF